MISISDTIFRYHEKLQNDPHQRYKSWEHCYSFFRGYPELEEDLACLHLGFYLASWGMYRGSSFLLQKDYKVHHFMLTILLNPKYEPLWNAKMPYIQEINLLILALGNEIKRAYSVNIQKVDGKKKSVNVTDTLVTKILLGTIGCVPAYDRYFISGLKVHGLKNSKLNQQSLFELIGFYNSHKNEFQNAQKIITFNGLEYPAMKLLDMYFWQLGFERETN